MTEQNRKWSESPIHDQVKRAGLDNAGAAQALSDPSGSTPKLPRDCRTCSKQANFHYGATICDKGKLPTFECRCRSWEPSGRLTKIQEMKERVIHWLSL